jgi:hypothetical protein
MIPPSPIPINGPYSKSTYIFYPAAKRLIKMELKIVVDILWMLN